MTVGIRYSDVFLAFRATIIYIRYITVDFNPKRGDLWLTAR